MSEEQFLADLSEMMDTEADISMDTTLADVEEWDSLSHVAFMSYLARHAKGKDISPVAVRDANTVRDLYNFVCGEA